MPIFKFFIAEAEGFNITAPVFSGAGDIVNPTGIGGVALPIPVFSGIGNTVGMFDIPLPLFTGAGFSPLTAEGSFDIPALVFSGTGDVGYSSIGIFDLPVPVFSGTGGSSQVFGTGSFAVALPVFSGVGVIWTEQETDPDESVDIILNNASGVRYI